MKQPNKWIKPALIFAVPVIIILVLTPLFPERIPMQFNMKGEVNWYLDRQFAWVLGFLPGIVYFGQKRKLRQKNH